MKESNTCENDVGAIDVGVMVVVVAVVGVAAVVVVVVVVVGEVGLMITRGGFAEVSECSLQDCLLLSSCSAFEDIPAGGKGELKPLVGCSRVPSE